LPAVTVAAATARVDNPRTGLVWAAAAYLSWGLFPVYFRAIRQVPPTEILAHRVVWSAVFLAVLVTLARRWPEFVGGFRSARSVGTYLLSTALIGSNWLLYIWAVNTGRILDASLGYFINPLVNVLFGVALLGEVLRPRQRAALVLAAIGVLVLAIRLGNFPWLALALAVSFGAYGLVRKKARIDPVVGLLVETSMLAPFAAALIAIRGARGTGGLGTDATTTTLLLSAGVITAMPLIWFARGVRTLQLSTMGLLQYLSPTLQFLLAVWLYREPFTRAHALAFGCIWSALAVYTTDALYRTAQRTGQPRRARAADRAVDGPPEP
jgi:chloramphenicol-sensitive protein RarD